MDGDDVDDVVVQGDIAATFSRFFKRSPHALHSVDGPDGPPLRTGVSDVPHSSHSHRGCVDTAVTVAEADADGLLLSFAAAAAAAVVVLILVDDDGVLIMIGAGAGVAVEEEGVVVVRV